MLDLKDKVAIVTGSGRGNGRGVAIALAEHGAAVMVCAICNNTDMMFVNRVFGGPEGGGFPEGMPINLGHESAGVVIALGEKVRISFIKHGFRVRT